MPQLVGSLRDGGRDLRALDLGPVADVVGGRVEERGHASAGAKGTEHAFEAAGLALHVPIVRGLTRDGQQQLLVPRAPLLPVRCEQMLEERQRVAADRDERVAPVLGGDAAQEAHVLIGAPVREPGPVLEPVDPRQLVVALLRLEAGQQHVGAPVCVSV